MAKKILDLGSSTVDETVEIEKVALFKLDDVTYYAPKKVKGNVSLVYMEKQAEEGPDAANYYMMKTMLGADAWKALRDNENLELEDLEKIMQVLEQHMLADEEGK